MPTVTGIAFIMYPVTDMARAIAFYQDVLGLQKSGIDQPYWVEFEVAGTTFGVGTFEPAGKPGTAQSLAVEVADMTQFRADAQRARLRIQRAPRDAGLLHLRGEGPRRQPGLAAPVETALTSRIQAGHLRRNLGDYLGRQPTIGDLSIPELHHGLR